jgi:outer membrane receptor protein involved in Fe transport
MKNRTIKGLISLAVIQGLLLVPMHGFAQGTSVNIIEEVLVTAQKREESSRDIASSLSVVSDQQLDDSQVINVLDSARYWTSKPVYGRRPLCSFARGWGGGQSRTRTNGAFL